ncbi:MAG: SDR family oxidoreductase, partial [Halioglobus sp.]|nr:SDR family oxidoreductase [Halioglobus sp.]
KMTAHMLEHEEAMAAGIPRRRLGDAQDAAGTAIYLCSRASAWMTGQVLVLDGGLVANAG